MLEPIEGYDEASLLRMLRDEYGAGGEALRFVPLGEDSWCYRAGRLWVSVRRDLRGHDPKAYEAARELRRNGLEFVLAPLAGRDGCVVHHVQGLPVVVFPYRAVSPIPGASASPHDADRVVALLSRLHGARFAIDLPTESFELSFSADIDAALAAPEGPAPESGPLSERLHRLLCRRRGHIAALKAEIEHLAAHCRAEIGAPVLTHGEPLASNILRSDGDLLIGDWGDLMWGPPERDWSHVKRTIGGIPECRSAFLRYYDVRWILSEIAEYTALFLVDHIGHADDLAMWTRLTRYLPEDAAC